MAALMMGLATPGVQGPAIAAEAGRHGIAMHGEPALPADFTHFPYANPDAPKGGRIVFGAQGTFDSLNPFPVKGLSAAHGITSLVIETLMRRSLDEPFTLYPLIARSIEVPADRSAVTFHLDPRARFSDGKPVTPADVRFTFELLREHGRPNYRNSYAKVAGVDVPDDHTIRFDLAGANDRELPLILGLMPVLARHSLDAARFEATSFRPLLGSGPYTVAAVKPGESISYRRDPTYWGADLPGNRGTFNFDEVRYDYYRDANSLFEAFRAGLYDYRVESDPTRWLSGYAVPAVRDGRIVREAVPSRLPKGMTGFVFNTRHAPFDDVRVREALGFLFDFEWINKNLFSGVYRRTGSYFEGSPDISARGRPADAEERALLAPFPEAVRDDVLEGRWQPLVSDGSGRDREPARRAIALLASAGFRQGDGVMRHRVSGAPLSFEIMVISRDQERIALTFAKSLSRIGVVARVKAVDSVQFERRRQRFEFDMMIASWPVSPSPGNEQIFRWGSQSAQREASFNFAGAKSPAIDAMIEALLAAASRDSFTAAVRALDRVLLSGFYVVPLYHLPEQWLAYNAALKRPATMPLFGPAADLWWRVSP
ncbi:MAG TPA: extracellular solute-binding protein [Beijerinckiaceae bacterium]|nr:extracellular solute-binding protein [Beijerinckiaceae bacterium]